MIKMQSHSIDVKIYVNLIIGNAIYECEKQKTGQSSINMWQIKRVNNEI